ncbi:MAG: hypothetical protein MN733_00740, partial [Nitrososphaera sp.]|nr:hypothetical protein [Nitrososphaera sp.]
RSALSVMNFMANGITSSARVPDDCSCYLFMAPNLLLKGRLGFLVHLCPPTVSVQNSEDNPSDPA